MPKTSEQTHIAINDIVGLSEIAERRKVEPRVIWNHTRRYAFPKPVLRISNTPIWDWNDVVKFYETWEPSKGGYHTHQAQKKAAARPRRPRRQFMEGDPE